MTTLKNVNLFTEWLGSDEGRDWHKVPRAETIKYLGFLIDELDIRPKIPVITVTGTNGKGSTVHALAEILTHHGLQVGTFISPHLLSYCERVRLNQKPIVEEKFLAVANMLNETINIQKLRFYDVLLLMALAVFNEAELDVIILEVGIGGRLDSTNALAADVVILTSIGLDHMHILGATREAIGLEKIGLLRPDKIFVCGDPQPPGIIQQSIEQTTSSRFWLNEQFGYQAFGKFWDLWLNDRVLTQLPLPQILLSNVACALMAITAYFGKAFLKAKPLQQALSTMQLAGRCQRIEWQGNELILDVSHNVAAIENLAQFLNPLPKKTTFAIVGMMRDKEIASGLQVLLPYIDQWWFCTIDEARGATAHELADKMQQNHPEISADRLHTADSVEQAWQAIRERGIADMRIVVFGSFRIIEPMLRWLHSHNKIG